MDDPSFPYRLAASDLDGTLLGPKKDIGATNEAAVRELQRRGLRFVLASGRRHQNSLRYYRFLRLDGLLISCAGALIKDPDSGHTLREVLLPAELAAELVAGGQEHGWTVVYYHRDHLYVGERNRWTELYESRVGEQAELYPDDLRGLRGEAALKIVWYGDPERIAPERQRIAEAYGDGIRILSTDPENLEFSAPGANKAEALAAVADYYETARAQTLAFGDGENDAPMLRWAGLGVAVDGSHPEAEEAAALVGPPGPPEERFARAVQAVDARAREAATMGDGQKSALPLLDEVLDLGRQARVNTLSVACYDYACDLHFSFQAEKFFHAASTIKLAILLALFRAVETGQARLTDRLHVRNRFRSRGNDQPFNLQADRDGDPELYRLIGRTAGLQNLAETMIVRSSNLATNLLLDHLKVAFVGETLATAGLESLRCLRGVEDEAAFAKGLNNQVTASGLLTFFRRVHEAKILSPENRDRMFDILFQQRFNSMIPGGLPESARARVAHKTGEISTVCHDAGMVFLPGRAPYVLAILTEYSGAGSAAARHKTVAAISSAVYRFLTTLPAALPPA